jgi:hypothetical protein
MDEEARMVKKIIVLTGSIWLALALLGAADAQEHVYTPQITASTPITAGAKLHTYLWDVTPGRTRIHVIELDLNNPHVNLGVIPGAGLLTQKSGVSDMALNYGAVAAVNGDFFNTRGEGAPIGPMVYDGQLISSPSVLEGTYALGMDQDRTVYIEPFTFSGRVRAPDGTEFPLSGLNKSFYWEEPYGVHSHVDKLHLYSAFWGGLTRGQDAYTTPTEMLVYQGAAEEILSETAFPFPVPERKVILRADGAAARFLSEHFHVGDPVDIQYQMTPERNWAWVIGGHALLVDQGQTVAYTKDASSLDGWRARTAAGISRDGKTLYLVGVEKNGLSAGLGLSELAAFMQHLGVWQAVNLDGGGSATMVVRPLGDFSTVRTFAPEQGNERLVVNALAVYTQAPAGQEQHWVITGEQLLLVGEPSAYALKGYDEYYNPLSVSWVQWTDSSRAGDWTDNIFTARSPSTTDVTALFSGGSAALPVKIPGWEDIAAMSLSGDGRAPSAGSSHQLMLRLRLKSGEERVVPPELAQWRMQGMSGRVTAEGVLQVEDRLTDGPTAFVTAQYQGFTAPLVFMTPVRQRFDTFSTLENVLFDSYPEGLGGGLTVLPDPLTGDHLVTRLQYDLTAPAAGAMAAYARFAGDGVWLDTAVTQVTFDLYGAEGDEWLRAELVDGRGEKHRLDLANGVSWTGWKQVGFDVPDLPQPLMLRQIYVATTGSDGRKTAGSVLLDNLTLLRRAGTLPPPSNPTVELVVGQTSARVNGTAIELDSPPFIWQNRTLVPVRFLAEATGASVLWDPNTRNVTIIRGMDWIDLWLDDTTMMKNGTPVLLDVPAQLVGGRTMLPLRTLAESLQITLDWDEATQKITLQGRP